MRAVIYRGRSDIVVDEVPEPTCGPGEVKVRVGRNGICGSDLHEYYAGPIFIPTKPHPLTGVTLPVILGHEFSGIVTEVGSGVEDIPVGSHAAIEPVYRCDQCPPCLAGTYNLCQNIAFHGLMARGGGMAEYTVVQSRMAHILPESITPELGALVEPMAVAYHACRLAEVGPGDSAVVFGAGPIGIGLWFALRAHGLDDITVVEPSAVRRDAIGALGATDVIDPTQIDPVAHVRSRTGGQGAGAVFDAAGVEASVSAGLGCIAARRPMISVAIYEQPLPVTLNALVLTEGMVRGSLCYTGEDYTAVIDLMARGHYDATGWVTHIPIDAVIDEGFEALRAGRKTKVLVDPTG